MKHTLGPWRFEDTVTQVRDCTFGTQIWGPHVRIGFTERQNVGADEERANARLIAAAPDLLEALKLAQDAVLALSRRIDLMNASGADIAALDMAEQADLAARQAIAKAEGE